MQEAQLVLAIDHVGGRLAHRGRLARPQGRDLRQASHRYIASSSSRKASYTFFLRTLSVAVKRPLCTVRGLDMIVNFLMVSWWASAVLTRSIRAWTSARAPSSPEAPAFESA